MGEISTRAVVEGLYRAFGEDDLDGVIEQFTEDAVLEIPVPPDVPLPGHCRGKEEIRRFFAGRVGTIEYTAFVPEQYVEARDHVTVYGHSAGRAVRSGRTFAYAWVQQFELRGGRITRFTEYFDTHALQSAFADPAGEDATALVRKWLDQIVAAGGAEMTVEQMAPDAIVRGPGASEAHGPRAWAAFRRRLLEEIPDPRIEVDRILARGSEVSLFGRIEGRAREDGSSRRIPLAVLACVRNGRIVELDSICALTPR